MRSRALPFVNEDDGPFQLDPSTHRTFSTLWLWIASDDPQRTGFAE